MADHVRKQIRDAVVTLLTGLTTTGTNVFASRVWPLNENDLPCLLVFATDEQSERRSMGGGYDRELNLVIQGIVRTAEATLDDALDTIALEVETVMNADRKFGGLASQSYLRATELTLDGEGDKPHGLIRLTYAVRYQTG